MNVAFRVDASNEIGTGHFMRCLTLADALKQRDAGIRFVSRHMPPYLRGLLSAKGYAFVPLNSISSEDANNPLSHAHWLGTGQLADARDAIQVLSDQAWDWLVVDHYALDARWESALRQTAQNILVIDDIADRQHDCNILLDQNYYRDMDQRYQGLLPEQCVTLLGPAYVLLRPEFAEAKQRLKTRDGAVKRILVFFGGSDPCNQTQKVVEALQQLNRPDIDVDVVVGPTNFNRDAVQALCEKLPNVTFHCQISNMAELILNADLGIGAGGSAMWERCHLGLPTITVVLAANQLRTTEDVAEIGAIKYLGWSDLLMSRDYAQAIAEMIDNPQQTKLIGDAALGVLQTTSISVADIMHSLVHEGVSHHFSDCADAETGHI